MAFSNNLLDMSSKERCFHLRDQASLLFYYAVRSDLRDVRGCQSSSDSDTNPSCSNAKSSSSDTTSSDSDTSSKPNDNDISGSGRSYGKKPLFRIRPALGRALAPRTIQKPVKQSQPPKASGPKAGTGHSSSQSSSDSANIIVEAEGEIGSLGRTNTKRPRGTQKPVKLSQPPKASDAKAVTGSSSSQSSSDSDNIIVEADAGINNHGSGGSATSNQQSASFTGAAAAEVAALRLTFLEQAESLQRLQTEVKVSKMELERLRSEGGSNDGSELTNLNASFVNRNRKEFRPAAVMATEHAGGVGGRRIETDIVESTYSADVAAHFASGPTLARAISWLNCLSEYCSLCVGMLQSVISCFCICLHSLFSASHLFTFLVVPSGATRSSTADIPSLLRMHTPRFISVSGW
jgi:hypothetical protein